MTDSTSHVFGSRVFRAQLASLFRSQLGLIEELLEKGLTEPMQHILPLLLAIRDNGRALRLMEQADLLNEFILIQRIFVQRLVNCCYLINADQEQISRYFSLPIASTEKESGDGSADAWLEFAKRYVPQTPVSASLPDLREQVESISKTSGAPKEPFQMALASAFSKSSEILSGSFYGVAFQSGLFDRGVERSKNNIHASEEFCTGLFMGIGILDVLLKVLGKRDRIAALVEKSAVIVQSSREIVKGSLGFSTPALTDVDGEWELLNRMENIARERLKSRLLIFEPAFQGIYEAGLVLPVINEKCKSVIDIRTSALFLKRALNDLRCVWVLLLNGYTSQAGCLPFRKLDGNNLSCPEPTEH